MFRVSPKTISRWREQGLVSRRLIFDGGRKRLGFLQSSVDRFVARNQRRVLARRAVQPSDEQRAHRDHRAGAALGACRRGQSETARRIARYMNRSVETIRYTLKQFDQKHPDLAIFPDNSGPLSDELKEKIYQEHQRGVGVVRSGGTIPAHAHQHLPRGERNACQDGWRTAVGLCVQRRVRAPGRRAVDSGPMPEAKRRPRPPRIPAACPPIWPLCTKSRS
jgi:hypothetical protein